MAYLPLAIDFNAKKRQSKRIVLWWALLGSNQRPLACRASALPTELSALTLALLYPSAR